MSTNRDRIIRLPVRSTLTGPDRLKVLNSALFRYEFFCKNVIAKEYTYPVEFRQRWNLKGDLLIMSYIASKL